VIVNEEGKFIMCGKERDKVKILEQRVKELEGDLEKYKPKVHYLKKDPDDLPNNIRNVWVWVKEYHNNHVRGKVSWYMVGQRRFDCDEEVVSWQELPKYEY
jgi:hypothetical protein